jgi:hypothetical protein
MIRGRPQIGPSVQCCIGAEAAPRSRIVAATNADGSSGWNALREPIARPGGWGRAGRSGSPPGGDGPRGRVRPSGPAPGACPRGGERTPARRAPSRVIAERQLPCGARVPPHATLPGRDPPCVQLRGDLRPGEALSPKPDDPLTDLLGHRPPTSHTPIVPLRLEAVAGGLSASHEHLFEQVRTGVLLLPSRAG